MGIPKFYRWLSERYPLLNMKITATEAAPDIDNLYLDMNGIIHNCTHANQREVKLTEDEMVLKVFGYLEKLVQVVKPKKLLFMAIDGVAPRAKMNQQRSRRFKAAEERLKVIEDMKKKGEEVPADPFDSNCITPGTGFMDRLGNHLRFFIRRKKAEDPLWQKPAIVFSGHDIPGEGEHKVMEYIRLEKKLPGYAANQRHCLYGLDADLIMLSLVTHEPHFCLLREVVSYTGGGRGQPSREALENPCAENFILFQIGLLREYWELEFSSLKTNFPVDIERIVDDFVLFCMLIGNDFLPSLPTLDIAEGALNRLIDLYKELLPQLGGYLTRGGQLDCDRLEKLLGKLGELEQEVLQERAQDAAFMERKRAKRVGRGGDEVMTGYVPPAARAAAAAAAAAASKPQPKVLLRRPTSHQVAAGPSGPGFGVLPVDVQEEDDLQGATAVVRPLDPAGGGSSTTLVSDAPAVDSEIAPASSATLASNSGGEIMAGGVTESLVADVDASAPPAPAPVATMMSKEARDLILAGEGGLELWKDRYYHEKLELPRGDLDAKRRVMQSYLEGLHWVLEYYYRGVASWNWYYPYHYAPMASDMVNLRELTIQFTYGKPFLPFEQLLGVLPAASAKLLPEPYQWLMTSDLSPIKEFYPLKFDVDMEGKRADWEGIVKVPFVDEVKLLKAAASIPETCLTEQERRRNKLGDILVFTSDAGSADTEYCKSTLPSCFRDVGTMPRSQLAKRPPPPPLTAGELGFQPVLVPGTTLGENNPAGVPTLKTLKVNCSMKSVGVNVLGMPSKKDSLILSLKDVRELLGGKVPPASHIAPMLIGQRCFVNWPYLQEARIVSVSDMEGTVYLTGSSENQTKKWQSQEAAKWSGEGAQIAADALTKKGIDVGKVDLMVGVRVCRGFVRNMDGTIQRQYDPVSLEVPLQAITRQRPSTQRHSSDAGSAPDEDQPTQVELKEGLRVVFLGKQHYGCTATILPDLGEGMSKHGKVLKSGNRMFRVAVDDPGSAGEAAARISKRVAKESEPKYIHSGEAAKRVGASPRTLGRITGNVWVQDGEDRYDIGLAVKHGGKGMCVPGYCIPGEEMPGSTGQGGWFYSTAMISILQEYKSKHRWVWIGLDKDQGDNGSGGSTLRLASLLPDKSQEERRASITELQKWTKGLPLARRPLVKSNVKLMTEDGIKLLQISMPAQSTHRMDLPSATNKAPATIEYENVPPALLLPPYTPSASSIKLSIQGGEFDLGDRVTSLGTGIPGFGLHGTVIGVFQDAVEVMFDNDFPGGTDLGGRVKGACGGFVPRDLLLNCSKPVQLLIAKSQVPVAVLSSTSKLKATQQRPSSVTQPQLGTQTVASITPGLVKAKSAASAAVASGTQPSSSTMPLPPQPSSLLLKLALKEAGGLREASFKGRANKASSIETSQPHSNAVGLSSLALEPVAAAAAAPLPPPPGSHIMSLLKKQTAAPLPTSPRSHIMSLLKKQTAAP